MMAYSPAVLVPPEQQSAADNAIAWLRSKWAAFLALDPKIEELQHRTAIAAYGAAQRGDANAAALAKESIVRLGELRQLHDKATSLFSTLRSNIPGLAGLPIVPVALVATVLALAAMVTYIFSRVNAEERIVRLLELGQLTPAQASELLAHADSNNPAETLAEFGGSLKWIVLGVLGFMAVRTVRELIA